MEFQNSHPRGNIMTSLERLTQQESKERNVIKSLVSRNRQCGFFNCRNLGFFLSKLENTKECILPRKKYLCIMKSFGTIKNLLLRQVSFVHRFWFFFTNRNCRVLFYSWLVPCLLNFCHNRELNIFYSVSPVSIIKMNFSS